MRIVVFRPTILMVHILVEMSQLMIVVLEKTSVEMLVIPLEEVLSQIRLLHQLIQVQAAMLAMLDTMLWKEL